MRIMAGIVRTQERRREVLKRVYDGQVQELTEANEPTQISVYFEDVIRALPNIAVGRNDLEALFRDALEHATGMKL